MLTPSVKFLWEADRIVLEHLRNNVPVEKLYHDTAQKGLFNSNIHLSILLFTSIDEIIIIIIIVLSKTQGHTYQNIPVLKHYLLHCKGGVCKILKFNNCDKRNKTILKKTQVMLTYIPFSYFSLVSQVTFI